LRLKGKRKEAEGAFQRGGGLSGILLDNGAVVSLY
jgi:hypothetical protein